MAPTPEEGRAWLYTASTSDGSRVLVRYHQGQWEQSSSDGLQLAWVPDDDIPNWPGTFTPAGGLVSGPGRASSDSVPALLSPGYLIPKRIANNAGEPIGLRGQPKTPEFAEAIASHTEQVAAAHAQMREAATRAALRDVIRADILAAIDGAPCIRKDAVDDVAGWAADAAIDAFVDAVRGGRVAHITTPADSALRRPPDLLIYDGIRYVRETEFGSAAVMTYPYAGGAAETPGPGSSTLKHEETP